MDPGKQQRLNLLKRFINKQVLKSINSVQQIDEDIVISDSNEDTNAGNSKRKKKKFIPKYLKEDFPSKTLHLARREAKKICEIKTSPPATECNNIIDKSVYKA